MHDRYAHDVLQDPDLSVGERLRYAVGALNRGRYLLVIDNFEVNLDYASNVPGLLDPQPASRLAVDLAHTTRRLPTSMGRVGARRRVAVSSDRSPRPTPPNRT